MSSSKYQHVKGFLEEKITQIPEVIAKNDNISELLGDICWYKTNTKGNGIFNFIFRDEYVIKDLAGKKNLEFIILLQ